jgi:hypothetical protein
VQLIKALSWTGGDLTEFRSSKWVQKSQVSLNAENFKCNANSAFDSVRTYYFSNLFAQKFGKVVIKNYRIVSKTYIESSDSARINKIWRFLSQASAHERNLNLFLIQMPVEVAALSVIDFDLALLTTPFVYPALIGTEIFAGNRLLARKTFKIVFYPHNRVGKKLVLKIRKSKIICSNYIYQLPSDFKANLSSF